MSYKNLNRWRTRAKVWLIDYAGGRCQVCGYDKWRGNLIFHHTDPHTKDSTVSDMLRRPRAMDTILIEVDKCVLVCRNCHGEIHAGLAESPSIDLAARAERKQILEDSKPIPKSHKFRFCPTCGERIRYDQKHCYRHKAQAQERIEWPVDLPDLVKASSKRAVAVKLGISDKAVAKRLKNHHGWN